MKSSKFVSKIRQSQELAKEFVDLHMHSTFSDGALGVRDLIDHCLSQGLSAIAIYSRAGLWHAVESRLIISVRSAAGVPRMSQVIEFVEEWFAESVAEDDMGRVRQVVFRKGSGPSADVRPPFA